ncbi:glycosyltransferase family 2 protein [Streptomyces sp. NPDC048290]|uniref:glycosyltransferase family 2 protein n=1 Tax=Streptomyces sp. NPDC048290 TaxID=3155811 RepID=UPI003432F1A1
MPVKVSVIVPVYNPGHYIDDCVDSLLRQSLPPDAYEIVFVDDGSTDATPARLDALAAEHERVHVVHQENSGWSGKPRNVGIAAARGEFVMFVDNDDYLGDEALERMYDYGVAHGADVVVGKMAGKGRGVPVELFKVNRPRASVENAPLIDSLTPHKMVRREFLERTGLRFPEGRRRLEDHVFVTEAFLRAANVSVLSDYVCYYHVRRDDSSNAGFQRFDPAGYFGNLREALDVVERYTEPGAVRDRLFRRWLRNEMVERLRGQRFLSAPEDFRRDLFEQIHRVVVERFGPGVAKGLQPTQRVVAALAAAGRYDEVTAFAEWESGIGLRAVPERVEWRDGALRVGLSAELTAHGEPLTFPAGSAADGSAAPGDGPPLDVAAAVDWVGADTRARFDRATLEVQLRERASSAVHFQPVEYTRERVPVGDGSRVRLVLRGTATVDGAGAVDGGPPPGGLWDLDVRVKLGGWTKGRRVGPAPAALRTPPPAGVVAGQVLLPFWTPRHGNLSLDVDRARENPGLERTAPDAVRCADGRLTARLALHVAARTAVVLRLTAAGADRSVDMAATLVPDPRDTPHGALLEAELPVDGLDGGREWRPSLNLTPEADEADEADEVRFHPLPVRLRAGTDGTVTVLRATRAGALPRLTRRIARRLRVRGRRRG